MANKEKMVTITQKEYNKLLEDSNFLEALRGVGVDNWEGYSEAFELLEEWNNEDEEYRRIDIMKVKVLSFEHEKSGEIVEAKRYKELTNEELRESVFMNDELWDSNDIFIYDNGINWEYMMDNEVEVVEE